MPRRNHRKGKPQAARQYVPPSGQPQVRIMRPKLEPMVPTSGFCDTGKLRYASSTDAKEALKRAQTNRMLLGSDHVETRWYPKPGDRPCPCGGYHLTSTEPRKPEVRK